MLLQRCLTAALLLSLVIASITFAPPMVLNALGVLMLFGCILEWCGLLPEKRPLYKVGFIVLFFISLFLSRPYFLIYQLLGAGLWLVLLISLFYFPRRQPWGTSPFVALLGLIILPLAASSMSAMLLMPQGRMLFLYLIALVSAADTGGYFIGKQWGQAKLIPWVSPGKTIIGTLGGFMTAFAVSQWAWFYFNQNSWSLWTFQALCTILMAIVGDLSISMLKRRVHCKDTGTLLPGHGGLLDRLDSLLAAAPIFYGCYFL